MPVAVKQEDIARHLGVSRSLVARALGDDARISPASRRRVREAADRLGYDPEANHAARHLIANRFGRKVATRMIGCLYMTLSENADHMEPSAYGTQLLHGIRVGAHLAGYDVLLANPVRTLCGNRVDGVLCCGVDYWQGIRDYYADAPAVILLAAAPDRSFVAPDDADGIRQLVEHLVQLGHRRIAYFASPEDGPIVQLRFEAYRRSLRAHGIEPKAEWVRSLTGCGPFRIRAEALMAEWLQDGWPGCTALLVQNDEAAYGAITALRAAGRRVPEDISVVGFDGLIEEPGDPHLTTVNVPLRQIGIAGMEMLVEQIADRTAVPRGVLLQVDLRVGETTAPPRDLRITI